MGEEKVVMDEDWTNDPTEDVTESESWLDESDGDSVDVPIVGVSKWDVKKHEISVKALIAGTGILLFLIVYIAGAGFYVHLGETAEAIKECGNT